MQVPEPESQATPRSSISSSPPTLPSPQHYGGISLAPSALSYPMAIHPPPPTPPQLHYLPRPHTPPPNANAQTYTFPDEKSPWSTPLLACFLDYNNCCMTCWCPCLVFGYVSEIINEGRTPWYETGLTYLLLSIPGWILGYGFIINSACPYTFLQRVKMRKKFKIEGSSLADCAAHTFCQYCAMCQEFRELSHRGFEVPLGWKGNMDMHMRAAAVYQFTPPVEQQMRR